MNYSNISYNDSGNFSEGTPSNVSASLYVHVWITLLNVVVFLVGVFGNVLVVVVICRIRCMRTPTNYYLLNLSIADLLVLLICQPSALLDHFAQDRWYLGEFICKLVPFLENLVVHASIIIIIVISWGRYQAVIQPLKSYSTIGRNGTILIIICIWIVAIVTASPYFMMTQLERATFYDNSIIDVCRTKIETKLHHAVVIGSFCVFFALPILLLAYCYLRIMATVLRGPVEMKASANAQKSAAPSRRPLVVMILCIVLLFFVCLLPMRVVAFWLIYTPVTEITKLGLDGYTNLLAFSRLCLYVNSAGNPVIYNLASTRFRNAFKRMLGFRDERASMRLRSERTTNTCTTFKSEYYEKDTRLTYAPQCNHGNKVSFRDPSPSKGGNEMEMGNVLRNDKIQNGEMKANCYSKNDVSRADTEVVLDMNNGSECIKTRV